MMCGASTICCNAVQSTLTWWSLTKGYFNNQLGALIVFPDELRLLYLAAKVANANKI